MAIVEETISLSRSLHVPTLPKWLKWLAGGGVGGGVLA